MKNRDEEVKKDSNEKIISILGQIRSTLITFLVMLAILVVINVFLGKLVKVDGHSMDNTLTHGEILVLDSITYDFRDPKRFEIVVFPHDDKLFIKRVIGLPGETIEIKNGEFYVDGVRLETDTYGNEKIKEDMYGRASKPVLLGKDEYFCVGDNRNHSGDSRLEEVGNVKRSQFVGRAIFRLYPFSKFGGLNFGE